MNTRITGAAVLAAMVTALLFIVIAQLIAPDTSTNLVSVRGQNLDFVRVIRDSNANLKSRRLPERTEKAAPNKPPVPREQNYQLPPLKPLSPRLRPDIGQYSSVPGIGSWSSAGEDGSAAPLFRMPPLYPAHAERRGLEGWVDIEFSISPSGHVVSPTVLASQPPKIFDKAAKSAVLKWKYRPQIAGGVAVKRSGVRVRIRFELEKK